MQLHLDQLVDVGRVTRGEAAEDYKDLPARVSRHVSSYKHRHQLSVIQLCYTTHCKTQTLRTYLRVCMARLRELNRDGSPAHAVSTVFFRAAMCFFGFPDGEARGRITVC